MSTRIDKNEIKKIILELIRTDEEFKLAIAGALNLDTILNELKKLREDFNAMLKRIEAIEATLQEHTKILQEHTKILQEHSKILQEHSSILQEHTRILQEHTKILQGHSETLQGHSKILQENSKILRQHSILLQRLTYSIEEEAIDIITWRLKEKLNIDVKLDRLLIIEDGEEKLEININFIKHVQKT